MTDWLGTDRGVMVFVETPLTLEILAVVADHWGIEAVDGERLYGGEESCAYRIADHVVRIGPRWRSEAELEWSHSVAAHAAVAVPEALAPLRTPNGTTVVRVDERPVSVWPFRPGTWPPGWGGTAADEEEVDDVEDQAAALLARVHQALRDVVMPDRPGPGPEFGGAPELDDPSLDRWLVEFDRTFDRRQPLHGDFYAGNTLMEDGKLVGLLDWDEAFLGPAERELAWAAWEWGDGLWTFDFNAALKFVDAYVDAGGVSSRIDETMLCQLVRERIRREVRYERAARARRGEVGEEDRAYEARQLQAFAFLRPRAS